MWLLCGQIYLSSMYMLIRHWNMFVSYGSLKSPADMSPRAVKEGRPQHIKTTRAYKKNVQP
jgi:hypothetical protein